MNFFLKYSIFKWRRTILKLLSSKGCISPLSTTSDWALSFPSSLKHSGLSKFALIQLLIILSQQPHSFLWKHCFPCFTAGWGIGDSAWVGPVEEILFSGAKPSYEDLYRRSIAVNGLPTPHIHSFPVLYLSHLNIRLHFQDRERIDGNIPIHNHPQNHKQSQ